MKRSVVPVVFGVLNLVMAIFLLFSFGATILLFVVPMPATPGIPDTRAMILNDPVMLTSTLVQTAISVILLILLILGGIGLLMRKRIAWHISLGYGVLHLLSSVLGFLIQIFVVMPRMMPVYEAMGSNEAAQAGFIGGIAGGLIGTVCWAIYPIILIVFMLLPATRADLEV